MTRVRWLALLVLLFLAPFCQIVAPSAETMSSAATSAALTAIPTATTTSTATALWTYDRPANVALTHHLALSTGLTAVSVISQSVSRASAPDWRLAAEGGGDSGEFWQALKDQWAARDDTGSIGGYGKSQVPSWVFNEGYAAEAGETPVQAATRIMNEQYGAGNWSKGPGTEFNQIVKWVSRTGGKP